jgi:hypothetical protein
MLKEATAKIAVPSSAAAKKATGENRSLLERAPPARLPSPSPSIKALTTIVTDSILIP